MGWIVIAAVVGYVLGYHDGRWAKPPPPLKGTYEHTEENDNGNYDI